eukprot:TRINITY_DN12078_c0_g1_i1.p1 TRINITY_DN12078_c0_g1~~TRINITY_DN12078_c0_g1_i1.p1  ORF type:complete len:229 (+),score=17.55 TRINITY_DN12078_c0_g1_i1:52-738(+)
MFLSEHDIDVNTKGKLYVYSFDNLHPHNFLEESILVNTQDCNEYTVMINRIDEFINAVDTMVKQSQMLCCKTMGEVTSDYVVLKIPKDIALTLTASGMVMLNTLYVGKVGDLILLLSDSIDSTLISNSFIQSIADKAYKIFVDNEKELARVLNKINDPENIRKKKKLLNIPSISKQHTIISNEKSSNITNIINMGILPEITQIKSAFKNITQTLGSFNDLTKLDLIEA